MIRVRTEYKIIADYFGEIETISDKEIRYSFLLGNVSPCCTYVFDYGQTKSTGRLAPVFLRITGV
jgi:hypothetical protein